MVKVKFTARKKDAGLPRARLLDIQPRAAAVDALYRSRGSGSCQGSEAHAPDCCLSSAPPPPDQIVVLSWDSSPEPTSPARRDPSPPPWTDVEPDTPPRPPRYEPVTEPMSSADEVPPPEEDVVLLSSDPSRPPPSTVRLRLVAVAAERQLSCSCRCLVVVSCTVVQCVYRSSCNIAVIRRPVRPEPSIVSVVDSGVRVGL